MQNNWVRYAHAAASIPRRIEEAIRLKRLSGLCDSEGVIFRPTAVIRTPFKKTNIKIGHGTVVEGELIVIRDAATIAVGTHCFVGPGTRIWSWKSISIGHRVLIGHNVSIFDSNTHSVSAADRHARFKAMTSGSDSYESVAESEICIGDDVWIGANAVIAKGVTIGVGAVVGAASVITKNVPTFAIMAGNPARQIGESAP